MATSAFKSTSRRSSLAPGDAGSSNRVAGAHRRSRSLSRYSGCFPPPPPESDEFTTPRGRFVNKTRGSGLPEISLDDLADEFFGSTTKGFEAEDDGVRSGSVRAGRSSRRTDNERFRMETESSRVRGRSVSKKGNAGDDCDRSRQQRRSVSVVRQRRDSLKDEKGLFNGELSRHDRVAGERKGLHGNDRNSRLRRSVSVVRYPCIDLESDTDKSYGSSKLRSIDNRNFQLSSSRKQTDTFHVLRRSMSQKDFVQSHDNYSSHSSSLTDDEVRDVHSNKSGSEKTIQALYSKEKTEQPTGDSDEGGLYEVVRNEVRHAVHDIRTELGKVMVKTEPTTLANSDVNQATGENSVQIIAEIRRNYTNKLEQSEKRKQDLLSELAAEEQRGQELTNIVRELLPAQKQAITAGRPSRYRRRSNDKKRMSNRLIEEAEKYFEDFLSNVEDTDLSSFDGERSDTSSTMGGGPKLRELSVHNVISETNAILQNANSSPAETDGVLLPWLDWETSNDLSPLPCKTKEAKGVCDNTTSIISLASWSPEGNENSPAFSNEVTGKLFGLRSHQMRSSGFSTADGPKRSSFNMDDYLELQRSDDLLYEIVKQRHRIESGGLVLCGRVPLFS